jgi:hypothetical protein
LSTSTICEVEPVTELWLPRTGKGIVQVLVDTADYELIAPYRWYVLNQGYASAYISKGRRNRVSVRMHRFLMGLYGDNNDPTKIVDHINHNTHDNRRSNLRVVDKSANNLNRNGSRADTTSKYRGVCYCRRTGSWQATAMIKGKKTWLGRHATEELAAEAVRDFFASQGVLYGNLVRRPTPSGDRYG